MSTPEPHTHGPAAGGPPASATAPAGRTAMIVVIGGSVLTLLAFFAMPLIGVGRFSLTGAGVAAAPGSLGGNFGALALLWLIPIAAAATIAVAVSHLIATSGGSSGRGLAAGLLSVVAVLVYIVTLLVVLGQAGEFGAASQVFSLLGAGYWLGLIGAFVAMGGGLSARGASADG